MVIHEFPSRLVAYAPAKLNLFLEVLGKRPDGYHEVETLMVPVRLFDTLQAVADSCLSVQMVGSQPKLAEVPEQANLVYRALELLRNRHGVQSGARVRVIKRIPLESGLGGGSSDAACALMLGNRLWDLQLPLETLKLYAAELGSDVPFFLLSSAAIGRGRGEQVQPLRGLGGLWFVIAKPSVGLSTAAVYQACQPQESRQSTHLDQLLQALRTGNLQRAGRQLHNRLQRAGEMLEPTIGQLSRAFERTCPAGHLMTGSGTAYFGLYQSVWAARKAAGQLAGLAATSVFIASAGSS